MKKPAITALVLGLLLFWGGSQALAQITECLSPLTGRSTVNNLPYLKHNSQDDTIGIPIADDFSTGEGWPNPRFWADEKVWINSTFGLNMPSLGVATFDGLDAYGRAYDLNDNSSDTLADVLSSHFIEWPANPQNVFLSFMFQAGGRGEKPTSGDFLTLQFWSPADSLWTEVWRTAPTAFESFKHQLVEINDPKWLQDGFRFRFAAYGARSGAFDIWNLDYVRLEQNRNATDTLLVDGTFTRAHRGLLKNYTQIPWFHANFINPFVDNTELYYRKNGAQGSLNINLRGYRLLLNGTTLFNKNGIPWNIGPFNVETTVPVPIDPIVFNPPPSAPFSLEIVHLMTGANDAFRSNDSLTFTHQFDHFYAYDDGSAERAYGIRNVGGAVTALQFAPLSADTLKGLYVYFAETQVNASLNSFRIGLWEDTGSGPGNLIYLSDSLYKPLIYQTNQFVAFALDTPGIYLNRAVYIGLKQTTVNPLNVGLDVNLEDGDTSSYIYYSDGTNWFPSLFSGRLMVRPYFNYQPVDLGANNPVKPESKLLVYPNPAQNRLFIDHQKKGGHLSIFNISGQMMHQVQLDSESSALEINTAYWPRGLYFLRWEQPNLGRVPEFHKIVLH